VYDLLSRYLRLCGLHPEVLVNITDIDPKLFSAAKKMQLTPRQLADRFICELLRDASSLNISRNLHFAKVSDYVDVAKALITDLLSKGYAYQAGGNTYLDSRHSSSIGDLAQMSRQTVNDSRLDLSPDKTNPSDILLWNASERLILQFPDKVLGKGIPWWHMQDTSVAFANYGGIYDIHGGAAELTYPHHGSHLCQLRAITGAANPIKLWTYIGTVTINRAKMSKSEHNTIRIRDVVQKYGSGALRLYLYSKNYASELDFDQNSLSSYLELALSVKSSILETGKGQANQQKLKSKYLRSFYAKIADDLDTVGALRLLRKAVVSKDPGVQHMAKILGLE
jgi:cysteinyl-tRNA synthetase